MTDITPIHGSFLEVDPNDHKYAEVRQGAVVHAGFHTPFTPPAKVEYLLLDPSCSGSGIISRLDHLVDDGKCM
jgi:putative methyltransferase